VDQAILRAALELFIEQGVDGASIEQIAARAQVARTTLYRRWSLKEALIAQAIAEERGDPEHLASVNWLPPRSLSMQLVDALTQTLTAPNYRKLAARLIGSAPSCPELMTVYWNRHVVQRRELIGKILERARAEGLIRKNSDPEILLDLMGGAILYHLLVRPGARSRREMRRYLRKVLRELGLAGTPERAFSGRTARRIA
jgi:AcrR family transcriptional regulator